MPLKDRDVKLLLALGGRGPLIAGAGAVALGAAFLSRKTWGFAAAAIPIAA